MVVSGPNLLSEENVLYRDPKKNIYIYYYYLIFQHFIGPSFSLPCLLNNCKMVSLGNKKL